MKSYIHLYRTNSEFTEVYNGPDYDEPWLSLTEENMDVNYNKTPPEPPKELTAITFGTITWVTDVPATGGTATKDNCTYTIIARYIGSRPEDITSQVDDITGELAVEETTIEQRHEAGQLTLSASYCGFTATGNVTVYQEAVDFSTKPLTFNILSDGNIVWAAGNNPSVVKNIEYSLNDGEWTETDSDYYEISVNEGDSIKFRGYNESYGDWNMWTYHGFGSSTCMFTAEGNVMSLIDGDNYQSLTSVSEAVFINLFYNCTGLTSAENLVLPATTLANGCYSSMFDSCTSLTTAPELPATTLAQYCYSYMFYDCSRLTNAPELPATTLVEGCYDCMFYYCTSLTTAPELPATTLDNNCYRSMFSDCTSLTTAPTLPATTLADGCYSNMFAGCTGLTTAPALPATTLAQNCYYDMFDACTGLTTAPELPATTLAEGCYDSMFNGCASLNYIKCLATDISASYCTSNWVNGVAPTGTFVKHIDQDWDIGVHGIPEGWVIKQEGFAISIDNITFNESGGTSSIIVASSDRNWEAINESDWVVLSNTGGTTGETVISITVPSTFDDRETIITFTDGKENCYLTINQETLFGKPLTFNILSGGTLYWENYNGNFKKTIKYNLNKQGWVSITSDERRSGNMPSIRLYAGDVIQFIGDNAAYGNSSDYNRFDMGTTNLKFTAEGNIMSLIKSTGFKNYTTLTQSHTFRLLFDRSQALVSAENLILPATTLTSNCYNSMFYSCYVLKTPPKLPATSLASNCYTSMFSNCWVLTSTPELPATTLADSCYQYMFDGCTSLTTAPALPATTLADRCYEGMFRGCTSLTIAPSELPATALTNSCYQSMFYGCSGLTNAPELPAPLLTNYCYRSMFYNCKLINYIKCLATNISATQCTNNWAYGVASTGTFVKSPDMNDWTTGVNGIPNGWTVQDAS